MAWSQNKYTPIGAQECSATELIPWALDRPQADKAFDTGYSKIAKTMAVRLAQKRRLQSGSAPEENQIVKRQKLFATRGISTATAVASWRPKTIHRLATKRFCAHLDNMIRWVERVGCLWWAWWPRLVRRALGFQRLTHRLPKKNEAPELPHNSRTVAVYICRAPINGT